MNSEESIKRTNELLASYPIEELQARAVEHNKQARKDFDELKKALEIEECSFCSQSITCFDEENPCLHWLLWKAPDLKKKHFPQLFEQKGFHNISTYLRWIANCDKSFVNINDLTEESKSTNIIDLTIRYKNLEWSFICSENDKVGHHGTKEGSKPHYHFLMKKDGLVVIKYGYHFPFTDYDEFYFAMKEGKFDKLRPDDGRAAGIQTILDNTRPEEVIDLMTHSKSDEDALFKTDILIEAEEGHTISGDDIAEMLKERDKTGVPLAKLVDKLKNVKLKKIVSPGPAIPEKSKRSSRGKKKFENF
ncbi:hypothetical protein HN958_04810 [Candidatus Falkowbacteria bacterium]|jgi:hypothetical protein|nr:hypothetical protein [Candidatus Falkowbacteria bacterium]MBT7007791.1 hypothetical protein [Candidatus Falkowbacteria bacterium]